MASKKFYSFENLMREILEHVSESNKEECNRYINETVIKCGELCKKGEEVRALNEIILMMLTLKKEFELK